MGKNVASALLACMCYKGETSSPEGTVPRTNQQIPTPLTILMGRSKEMAAEQGRPGITDVQYVL